MSTVVGNSSYVVCISTGVESNAPSGDKLYILAKKWNKKMQTQNMVKNFIEGKSYRNGVGKRTQSVQISGTLPFSDLNNAASILDKTIVSTVSNPAGNLYLFIKHSSSGYVKWATTTPGLYSDYLVGIVENYSIDWSESSKLYEISLSFAENWGL